jgi:NDP-sugar pyrophosphorylase family protein
MRAIVIATGHSDEVAALNHHGPTEMIPMVDRPFIQHVVEYLVDKGVTEFDFILAHLPEKIEQLLGDGTRWGSCFRYHLVKDSSSPYRVVKMLSLSYSEYEEILLVSADRLPQIDVDLESPQLFPPVVFCTDSNKHSFEWAGWALVSPRSLINLGDDIDESSCGEELILAAQQNGSIIKLTRMLSVRSYENVLSSQDLLLNKEFSNLRLSGRESDENIWIARNVRLHPTARLVPPVYIGENCHIGQSVHLGPNAVVGPDCMLDARCIVSDSLILSGSYVGESLELSNSIVDKNRLINTSVSMAISVADDFILGSLSENHLTKFLTSLFSRLMACGLLAICWPLMLLTALYLKVFRRGRVFYKRDVVRLPADVDSNLWRTFKLWSFSPGENNHEHRATTDFFLRFLPALINIARGELHFVGVRPRSRAEIESLSPDWQSLYLKAKAGIVTEAFVLYGNAPTEDELYSTEAFYSVAAGFNHDLRLLTNYMGRVANVISDSNQKREIEDIGIGA